MFFTDPNYQLLRAEIPQVNSAARRLKMASEYVDNWLQQRCWLIETAANQGISLGYLPLLLNDNKTKEVENYFYLVKRYSWLAEELCLVLSLNKPRSWWPKTTDPATLLWLKKLACLFVEIDRTVMKLKRL